MKQLLFLIALCMSPWLYSQHVVLNELMSANDSTFADEDGDFSDWIELYNPTNSTINLEDFALSDDFTQLQKWTFPATSIPAGEYLVVFLSGKNRSISGGELHTDFRLKATGEYLILSNSFGTVVDHFLPVDLQKDYSYGRLPDGTDNVGFLNHATPDNSNNGSEFIHFIDFSHPQGFYSHAFHLEMNCPDSIYYTLDGSIPTTQSNLYNSSVYIVENTANNLSLIPGSPENFSPPVNGVKHGVIVRAQPYRNGSPSGPVHTRTYFTQAHDYSFHVLSIVTDSLNFFDQDTGIYVPGVNFDAADPVWSGNYHQRGSDWERSCTVTLFDKNGNEAFTEDMGVRIAGKGSRRFSQKSLRFYLRNEYGKSRLNYPLFPDRENREVKRFIARSSFTSLDWFGSSLFKDELIQLLAHLKHMDIDLQMAQPTIVYINGEYWGIQTIKERHDEHYLHSLYGVDTDSVDIIDGDLSVSTGSAADFISLLDFIELNDLSVDENYEYVTERVDITNFIDYYILETYFGNLDWPGNNLRLWRPHTPDGKWRFLLYDLDATVGSPEIDPISRLDTVFNDQSFLFKNLLLNQTFKNDFICRYQYHLSMTFDENLMKAFVLYFQQKYAPEIPRHVTRWNYPNTLEDWNQSCAHLEIFFTQRPWYMRSFLKSNFAFEDFKELSCPVGGVSGISVYPNPANERAYLELNDIELIGGNVSIYDAKGMLIRTKPVEYMTQHLPVENLHSGLYLILVQKNDVVRTTKLLLK